MGAVQKEADNIFREIGFEGINDLETEDEPLIIMYKKKRDEKESKNDGLMLSQVAVVTAINQATAMAPNGIIPSLDHLEYDLVIPPEPNASQYNGKDFITKLINRETLANMRREIATEFNNAKLRLLNAFMASLNNPAQQGHQFQAAPPAAVGFNQAAMVQPPVNPSHHLPVNPSVYTPGNRFYNQGGGHHVIPHPQTFRNQTNYGPIFEPYGPRPVSNQGQHRFPNP